MTSSMVDSQKNAQKMPLPFLIFQNGTILLMIFVNGEEIKLEINGTHW